MDKLEDIIKTGTLENESQNFPTTDDKINFKVSLLNYLKDVKNCFVMNLSLFEWKEKITKENINIQKECGDWLLEPLQIFCDNHQEVVNQMADKFFADGFNYVQVRNDIFEKRMILDVEFDQVAFFQENNKELSKLVKGYKLFESKVNLNPVLLMPILYYQYITPRYSNGFWKKNLELEKYLWDFKFLNFEFKTKELEISKKIYDLIKTEKDEDYLLSGDYTLSLLQGKENYKGDYLIFHQDPISFLKKVNENISKLEIKIIQSPYYFFNESYDIYHSNQKILTVYPLKFQFNFIKIGYHNHLNYQGLILMTFLEMMKEGKVNMDKIGFIIKLKNKFLKDNQIKSELAHQGTRRNFFQILQSETIGTDLTPQLEFNKKSWNKELKGFYRPDLKEKEEEKNEENNEEN